MTNAFHHIRRRNPGVRRKATSADPDGRVCLDATVERSRLDVVLAGGGRGRAVEIQAAIRETKISDNHVYKYCMGLDPKPQTQPFWALYQPELNKVILCAVMFGYPFDAFEPYPGEVERWRSGVFPDAEQVMAAVLMPQLNPSSIFTARRPSDVRRA
jgi:hypothetical protein